MRSILMCFLALCAAPCLFADTDATAAVQQEPNYNDTADSAEIAWQNLRARLPQRTSQQTQKNRSQANDQQARVPQSRELQSEPVPTDWQAIARESREFVALYPNSRRANEARKLELTAELTPLRGRGHITPEIQSKIDAWLADSSVPASDRLEISASQKEARQKLRIGMMKEDIMAARLQNAFELAEEYPADPRVWSYLLNIARHVAGQTGADAATRIIRSESAADETKQAAQRWLDEGAPPRKPSPPRIQVQEARPETKAPATLELAETASLAGQASLESDTPVMLAAAAAPSTPGRLEYWNVGGTGVSARWSASTGSGSLWYDYYLDGSFIYSSRYPEFYQGWYLVSLRVNHVLGVRARDEAGNVSAMNTSPSFRLLGDSNASCFAPANVNPGQEYEVDSGDCYFEEVELYKNGQLVAYGNMYQGIPGEYGWDSWYNSYTGTYEYDYWSSGVHMVSRFQDNAVGEYEYEAVLFGTGISWGDGDSAWTRVTVGTPVAPPTLAFDSVSQNIYNDQSLTGSGWAADQKDGAPVNRVEVWVNGNYRGNAALGGDRPDVQNAYGRADWRYSGFSFSVPSLNLLPGQHTVEVRAYNNAGVSASATKAVTIINRPPSITMSANGATVQGGQDATTSAPNGSAITFTFSASDPDGNYQRTRLWVLTSLGGDWQEIHNSTAASSTYTYTLNSLATYYFHCRSLDNAGVESATAIINITSHPRANDAEFVSQSVPATIATGASKTVYVTMRNTGTVPWNNNSPYPHSLGSQNPQDNGTWGLGRVSVSSIPVQPGQSRTFGFTITAPSTPGNYNFQWRMVQDGVEWFGGSSTNQVISVVNDPNPPGAPIGLTLANVQADCVQLYWNAPANGSKAEYYEVYVNGRLANTASYTPDGNPYMHAVSGVGMMTTGTITVCAVNALGSRSAQSNAVEFITPGQGTWLDVPAHVDPNVEYRVDCGDCYFDQAELYKNGKLVTGANVWQGPSGYGWDPVWRWNSDTGRSELIRYEYWSEGSHLIAKFQDPPGDYVYDAILFGTGIPKGGGESLTTIVTVGTPARQPVTASVTVDGCSNNTVKLIAQGSSTPVTVRYQAHDPGGALFGMRPRTNAGDQSDEFEKARGSTAEIVRTYMLGAGEYWFRTDAQNAFMFQNGDAHVSSEVFHITILENHSPDSVTINAPPATIMLGESIDLASTATDPDGNLAQHSFWRRGARAADNFSQDWDGWERDYDNRSNWSNQPAPGSPSGGTNSNISATFTPPSPGYWQFHANAWDGLDAWGPGATTGAVFVAPLPSANITASTAGGQVSATGGGLLIAYIGETITWTSTANASGWLSEHNVLIYDSQGNHIRLPGDQVTLPGTAESRTSTQSISWAPSDAGAYTVYTEAFTGRTPSERINGTSGWSGYFDGGADKRIDIQVKRSPTGSLEVLNANKVPVANVAGTYALENGAMFYVRVNGYDADGDAQWYYVRLNYPDGRRYYWNETERDTGNGLNGSRTFGPFRADKAGNWSVWAHVSDDMARGWGSISPWDENANGWCTLAGCTIKVTGSLTDIDPNTGLPIEMTLDTNGNGIPDHVERLLGFDPADTSNIIPGNIRKQYQYDLSNQLSSAPEGAYDIDPEGNVKKTE